MILWIKAFHIIFMVTWFAGIFYLPRLFVYHADTVDPTGHHRFCIMERRLSILMSIGAALTIIFGLALMWLHGGEWVARSHWLHVKLLLVLALIGYHGWSQMTVKAFKQHRAKRTANYYRKMNEVPTVLLIAIVILAVVKPF